MTTKEHSHEYYLKNKDKWTTKYYADLIENRRKKRQYYYDHKEEIKLYQMKHRKKISDCTREWRKKNLDKNRAYDRKYYAEDREFRKEKSRLYRDKHKEHNNKVNKEWRHKKGISKKYISDCNISKTKEYKSAQRQKRRALVFGGGELSVKTIQLVYEDNIKQYGTLTCYLCLQPVPFSKDHLEHKTPLSRGGNNEYANLGIACQRCNCRKNRKTEAEFRMEVF